MNHLHTFNTKRILMVNDKPIIEEGAVVYWMNRECRVHDNWAFIYAREQAESRKVPLVVVYNLVPNFLGGIRRQWDFKVRGLEEVDLQLKKMHIPFFLVVEKVSMKSHISKRVVCVSDSESSMSDFTQSIFSDVCGIPVGEIVTDFSPVKEMRAWTEALVLKSKVKTTVIDAHNIVPVHVASSKREFGAYTIRPKIHALLKEFLDEFPHNYSSYEFQNTNLVQLVKDEAIEWEKIRAIYSSHLKSTVSDFDTPVDWIIPGETHATKALHGFITKGLSKYHERNNPNIQAQSNLSPYLHYGQLAPQRVALDVWKDSGVKDIQVLMHEFKNAAGIDEMKKGDSASLFHSKTANHSAFLEELIVRRELADNFCFYTNAYDTVEAFPEWSKKNIHETKDDVREYVYTYHQFELAKTHDALWNAAEMQLLKTGKMHGYLRMYWAKKILEWTPDVQTALDIAIRLNDTYELDGRDPNGYAGIAWSIGGVHDRAWFKRPVFGQIRYMNEKGCRNKFDVDSYIKKWLE